MSAPDPAISIRPATQADVAWLASCLIAVARSVRDRAGSAYNSYLPDAVTPREFEYVLGFLAAEKRLALVAELAPETSGSADRRIGCLLAEIAPSATPSLHADPTGTIAACWVAPEFRRQGVARALVEQAEAWFRRQGVRFAELSYGADSETAGAAWAAQGYAPFRVLAVKDLNPQSNPDPAL